MTHRVSCSEILFKQKLQRHLLRVSTYQSTQYFVLMWSDPRGWTASPTMQRTRFVTLRVSRREPGKRVSVRMRCIYVVVCGGKMAALGDTSAPGVNGLIQQFTAITGKFNVLFAL